MTKKVLILAYDFPPYVSVGGLRPYNWFLYLKEFDIEPVVITRQWDNYYGSHLDYIAPSKRNETVIEDLEKGTIIRTPYKPNLANRIMLKYGERKLKFLRKVISFFFEIAQFLWVSGPKRNIYKAASSYLKENKVDCIITTGDPFILFHYASKLSAQHDVPWIADYRDPWSGDVSLAKKPLLRAWSKFLEKKALKSVSAVTTVDEFMRTRIPFSKPIHVINNGYNPDTVNLFKDLPQNSQVLSLGLVGTLYSWNPINSFFGVLNTFVEKHGENSIEFNLFGVNFSERDLEKIEVKYPKLKSIVHVFPRMKNEVLLEKLASNNLLLLFNYYSLMGTKIYDYIGIKRAILFCYSNDDEAKELKSKYFTLTESENYSQTLQEDLIRLKNAGYIVQDKDHLLEVLEQLYVEHKENGRIDCLTKDSEEFSRRNQTGKLAEIVHSLSTN